MRGGAEPRRNAEQDHFGTLSDAELRCSEQGIIAVNAAIVDHRTDTNTYHYYIVRLSYDR